MILRRCLFKRSFSAAAAASSTLKLESDFNLPLGIVKDLLSHQNVKQITPVMVDQVVSYIRKRPCPQVKSERLGWSEEIFKRFDSNTNLLRLSGDILVQLNSEHNKSLELRNIARDLYICAMQQANDDTAAYNYSMLILKDNNYNDQTEAFHLLYELAKKGHPNAQSNIARLLLRKSQPSKTIIRQAIEFLQVASRNGVKEASNNLGLLYFSGKIEPGPGIPTIPDSLLPGNRDEKAVFYFSLASKQGVSSASFTLGRMYAQGWHSLEADSEKSFEWFLKAAEQGLPEAQYNVGHAYFTGNGTSKNLLFAFEYWRLAAYQGFPLAMVNAGKMCMEGFGIPKDLNMAREFLTMALNSNNIDKEGVEVLLGKLEQSK